MTERISALMDGEFDGDVSGSDTTSLRNDSQLREVWSTYHLIGDVMRGDLYPAYERRVAKRLIEEPTVLAPRRTEEVRPLRFVRYALSAAASVAGVALVFWTAAPMQKHSAPELNIAQNQVPSVVSSRPAGMAGGVENYLLAHQRYSPSNAMHGVAPYVRLVSELPEEGRR